MSFDILLSLQLISDSQFVSVFIIFSFSDTCVHLLIYVIEFFIHCFFPPKLISNYLFICNYYLLNYLTLFFSKVYVFSPQIMIILADSFNSLKMLFIDRHLSWLISKFYLIRVFQSIIAVNSIHSIRLAFTNNVILII